VLASFWYFRKYQRVQWAIRTSSICSIGSTLACLLGNYVCTAWMNQETHAKRHRELKWETPQQSGIVWLQFKCCARPWYHSVCIRCAFDLALSSHSGSSCQVFLCCFLEVRVDPKQWKKQKQPQTLHGTLSEKKTTGAMWHLYQMDLEETQPSQPVLNLLSWNGIIAHVKSSLDKTWQKQNHRVVKDFQLSLWPSPTLACFRSRRCEVAVCVWCQ